MKHALDESLHGFIYVYEGDAKVGETSLAQHTFAVLNTGDMLSVKAGDKGSKFIMVAGRPIHEPIIQYGPFVMNTQEEIHQAFADYQAGKLVHNKASFVTA